MIVERKCIRGVGSFPPRVRAPHGAIEARTSYDGDVGANIVR